MLRYTNENYNISIIITIKPGSPRVYRSEVGVEQVEVNNNAVIYRKGKTKHIYSLSQCHILLEDKES